jgi:Galactose-3-O-sulfotransferase
VYIFCFEMVKNWHFKESPVNFCVTNTRCNCFDFKKQPIIFVLPPILFNPTRQAVLLFLIIDTKAMEQFSKSLRFLHIPKTAGQTLEAILLRNFSESRSFRFTGDGPSDIHKFDGLSDEEKKNVLFFYGHSTISTGISEADHAKIITILRDPVSRVKAFCQHVSEGKSPYLRGVFPPESFDLDAFLESGNQELTNLQAKLLINDAGYDAGLFETLSPAEARDLALENLYKRIAHFGLQEYFDESMILFRTAMNWSMPIYRSKNLENPNKLLTFKDRHIEKIRLLNTIDTAIYDQAKQRFFLSLDKISNWKTKLKIYRMLNKSAQLAYKTVHQLKGGFSQN